MLVEAEDQKQEQMTLDDDTAKSETLSQEEAKKILENEARKRALLTKPRT